MTDIPQEWRDIVASDDQTAAVTRHLRFLTGSPACEELLDELMATFVEARVDDDALELVFRYAEFDEECVISCDLPHSGVADGVPASVADVVRVHNGIGWESIGGGGFGFWGLQDGVFVGGGGWESKALTEAAARNAVFLAQLADAGLTHADVICPCEFGQNWLIWHPVEQNLRGEPVLYFVSHGDCVATPVEAARELAFGPLLLRVMAQDILDKNVLDGVYT